MLDTAPAKITLTSAKLEQLVVSADIDGLVKAVSSLTEQERRRLSKIAQTLKRDIDKARWQPESLPERLLQLFGKKKAATWEQSAVAELAVLALGPLSQTKKLHLRYLPTQQSNSPHVVLDVLRDRQPEWIDEWVAAMIAGVSPSIDWHTLLTLIQEGICQKPTSEDYYRAMAQLLNGWNRGHGPNQLALSDLLASEPTLLDDMWMLFEVDTVAFTYDWGEGRDAENESWPTAIFKLAERGVIDRDRLLDATLAGLTTGFKQNILGGFARLHEQLEPTQTELMVRQAVYFDLMSMQLPKVVSFAIKMIKKIDEFGSLDDAAFVEAASRVFDVPTKGPAKTVIGLLKKASKRRPDLVPQVSRVLINALDHAADDVILAAVNFLKTLAESLDETVIQQIASRLSDLPAAVRPLAEELVGLLPGDSTGNDSITADSTASESITNDLSQRLAECRRRATFIDSVWREKAGVDDALTAILDSTWAPPFDVDPMSVPILSGLSPVKPIASLDELIDAVAHGIEHVDSAIEVERILDGISRLCDQRPDSFAARVAPLIKRIEGTAGDSRGIANPNLAPAELARTVLVWLTGNKKSIRSKIKGQSEARDVTRFLNSRLESIRQRVVIGQAAPLLAMPTHERGWIDPVAIVTRWQQMDNGGTAPSRVDLIQSLLRMAPDGRDRAIEKAITLSHPWARALRWGMGGDDGPRTDDGGDADFDDADIWLAAGRARSPFGQLDELAVPANGSLFELLNTGPDAIHAAKYRWHARVREVKDQFSDKTYRIGELELTTQPVMTEAFAKGSEFPTVLLHFQSSRWSPYELSTPWGYDWISMLWPANVNAYFARGAQCLVHRLDDTSSNLDPNHTFLTPLFDVDRPWTDVAKLLAVLGIAGRDQDVRGLAVDALVEAIADGRCDADALGQTLSTLTMPYWLKLNRVCDNLSDVARVSPLHAWTVLGGFQHLVTQYKTLPKDAHHLLALVLELQAELGLAVPDAVRTALETVKGTSKTAKLAKAICSYSPSPRMANASAVDEARMLSLESRLSRAERWAAIDG